MITTMIEQIDRRRSFYLTLVHGSGVADPRVAGVHESVRSVSTDRVVGALGLDPALHPVVHAGWAYVEDRALNWSALPSVRRVESLTDLVEHCERALAALCADADHRWRPKERTVRRRSQFVAVGSRSRGGL